MGESLRVVSYNIHSSRDDLSALAQTIQGLKPDVLILQEGPRRFRWRAHCAGLARAFRMVHVAGGLPSLGNVIMTSLRPRVLETSTMQFPLTPGRHLRGAVFASCAVGGTRVTIVGAHLSTDATERPGQAQLLKKALVDADSPVIFGADLNETPGGSAWRMLADGLTDAGAADDAPTFPVSGPNRRIDALLVDPRLRVRGFQVVQTPAARLASDHFPLVVDLELPAGTS